MHCVNKQCTGRIGSAIAVRAQVFGFDVAFYDPWVPLGTEKVVFHYPIVFQMSSIRCFNAGVSSPLTMRCRTQTVW